MWHEKLAAISKRQHLDFWDVFEYHERAAFGSTPPNVPRAFDQDWVSGPLQGMICVPEETANEMFTEEEEEATREREREALKRRRPRKYMLEEVKERERELARDRERQAAKDRVMEAFIERLREAAREREREAEAVGRFMEIARQRASEREAAINQRMEAGLGRVGERKAAARERVRVRRAAAANLAVEEAIAAATTETPRQPRNETTKQAAKLTKKVTGPAEHRRVVYGNAPPQPVVEPPEEKHWYKRWRHRSSS